MIINRRDGKEQRRAYTASHRIKIGMDVRPAGQKWPTPRKLNGFLIVRNSKNTEGGSYEPDYDAMEKLGYPKAQVDEAIRLGLTAKRGTLPSELSIILPSNAIFKDGQWQFGFFDENYGCDVNEKYEKDIGFCRGNGDTAIRQKADRTKDIIVCNPVGKIGVAAEHFCPFSAKSYKKNNSKGEEKEYKAPCRNVVDLVVFVYGVNLETARPFAISRLEGASFHFHSTSENSGIGISAPLIAAAERCDGNIGGVTGTLHFGLRNTEGPDGSAVLIQQVNLSLNEFALRKQEKALQGLEMARLQRVIEVRPEPKALPAPELDVEPIEGELEEELAAPSAQAPKAAPKPRAATPKAEPKQEKPTATEPAAADPTREDLAEVMTYCTEQAATIAGGIAPLYILNGLLKEAGGKKEIDDPKVFFAFEDKPKAHKAIMETLAKIVERVKSLKAAKAEDVASSEPTQPPDHSAPPAASAVAAPKEDAATSQPPASQVDPYAAQLKQALDNFLSLTEQEADLPKFCVEAEIGMSTEKTISFLADPKSQTALLTLCGWLAEKDNRFKMPSLREAEEVAKK